jgi:hypothetical protein
MMISTPATLRANIVRVVLLTSLVSILIGILCYWRFDSASYRGTIFGPGYSEEAFRIIHRGMSCVRVRAILGDPVKAYDAIESETNRPVHVWEYSQKKAPDDWWQYRAVVFDRSSRKVLYREKYLSDP